MSPELVSAVLEDFEPFDSKQRARRFGRKRDKRMAVLLSSGGNRRSKAARYAGWTIDEVFGVPDLPDDLQDEWQTSIARITQSAAAEMDRSALIGPANEAQALSVSTKAVSLVAAALGLWLMIVTERDEKVCERCHDAESGGPYPAGDEPKIPLHLHCRCIVHPIIR